MTVYLVGWDVGAWHCDRNRNSRDAFVALEAESAECIKLCDTAKPFHGNLRERLNTAQNQSEVFGLPELNAGDQVVLAIDATLGWPLGFRRLLEGELEAREIDRSSARNALLFRLTDRKLFETGNSPSSPVEDQLGSQSTKALFFLAKFGFRRAGQGIWRRGAWTVIETYPSVVPSTKALAIARRRIQRRREFKRIAERGRASKSDTRDALVCALVAWRFHFCRTEFPEVLTRNERRLAREEGWIWVPDQSQRTLSRERAQ